MSHAATLFYSADKEATTLHQRIMPSDEQYGEQESRWNDLADWLIAKLRDESGLSTDTKLQGSYKYGTQVNPLHGEEFDIDLGFIFKWAGSCTDGEHGAWDLKNMVQTALVQYEAENPDDVRKVGDAKPRCNRIHYNNAFHIDVPVYHLDTDSGTLSLATQDDEWEHSDPKALYLWYKNLVEDDYLRHKLRRQIRYIKAWAALTFTEGQGRPSSIMLTVLMAQAMDKLGDDAEASDDDLFEQLVASILATIEDDFRVENPVDQSENLNRLTGQEMTHFLVKLQALADTASRAVNADGELEAANIWQEAFSFLFPMPETLTMVTESARQLPVQTIMPEIRVLAYPKGGTEQNAKESWNEVGPVGKDHILIFEMVNHQDLPTGSECYWTVRNNGREAMISTDLGHYKGHGRTVIEHTAYNGKHFMDCTVKLRGAVIAQRRVPVTVIGAKFAVLRNPARPSWVKLRNTGRR